MGTNTNTSVDQDKNAIDALKQHDRDIKAAADKDRAAAKAKIDALERQKQAKEKLARDQEKLKKDQERTRKKRAKEDKKFDKREAKLSKRERKMSNEKNAESLTPEEVARRDAERKQRNESGVIDETGTVSEKSMSSTSKGAMFGFALLAVLAVAAIVLTGGMGIAGLGFLSALGIVTAEASLPMIVGAAVVGATALGAPIAMGAKKDRDANKVNNPEAAQGQSTETNSPSADNSKGNSQRVAQQQEQEVTQSNGPSAVDRLAAQTAREKANNGVGGPN